VELVVGTGKLDRTLHDVGALVDAYRTNDGLRYSTTGRSHHRTG
jgi:hypothetical protein